jgi:uncharacterized membrane protein
MRSLLLLAHLSGVIVWIGGMFFAHVCLRPVATAQFATPQRLPLLAGVLGRFFKIVTLAIALILASGLARLLSVGFANAPPHWHLMFASGLVMSLVFALIYLRHYPRLQAGVAAQDWPAAGAAMNHIRQLVLVNLILGGLTVVLATVGIPG